MLCSERESWVRTTDGMTGHEVDGSKDSRDGESEHTVSLGDLGPGLELVEEPEPGELSSTVTDRSQISLPA